LKKLIISRKRERNKKDIKSKGREIENVNSPKTSGLQGEKMQKKNSIKTDIHNQEAAEDSEKKCCVCWENYVKTAEHDGWIECVSCRNLLHEFCSPYKDKCFGCGRIYCERNTGSCRRGYRKFP
jgi:hypothetical protein